jgi:hypothetical protein
MGDFRGRKEAAMRDGGAFAPETPGRAPAPSVRRSALLIAFPACADAGEYGPEKHRAGGRIPEGDRCRDH